MSFEDRTSDDFIPGTLNLYAFEVKDYETQDHHVHQKSQSGLKTRDNIILLPQPTDSCNDPLNWNVGKKLWNFAIVLFYTAFTGATSNDAGSTQDKLNEIYDISYGSMNTGAGVLFLAIGTGTFILAPAAHLYGHKCSYFICVFLGLLGAVWFALQKSTSDTIWSQLFVGVSESSAESLSQLSISSLFFQDQLGSTLTMYMVATSVGTYAGPLVAGFIVEYAGFRWVGWIAVFISAGLLVVMTLGMHETSFDRTQYRGVIDAVGSNEDLPAQGKQKPSHDNKGSTNEKPRTNDKVSDRDESLDSLEDDQSGSQIVDKATSATPFIDTPKSWWQQTKLITLSHNLRGTGIKQYLIQLKLLFRVFLFVPVIYTGLVWGIQDALLTFYLTVEDDQYYDAPYNYTDVKVALMNIPCLIGACIGSVYAGVFSDWFSVWMAKRNNGIMEAEARLYFLFLPAIIAPVGLILFAVGTDQVWSWQPTYVGLGFIGFGFGASGDVAMAYLMAAYPDMVIEMMCGVAVVNNYLGCIFTFTCSLWLEHMSNTHTFIILAVIEFLIMMGALPMIIYGKRIRKWTKTMYLDFIEFRDGI